MTKKKSGAQTFHVRPDQANQTLSLVLRKSLPGTSGSHATRLLKSRQVQVNGNLCLDEGRRLKPNEVVRVLDHPAAPLPTSEDVRIVYLDQHVAVVEKPAGMTSIRHVEERR